MALNLLTKNLKIKNKDLIGLVFRKFNRKYNIFDYKL